ncbi:MAG: flagellar biosynthetic protein FliR [Pseudomonadota bacterium]
MIEGLAALMDMATSGLEMFVLVFMRIGGVMFLLPGFADNAIPKRVRLALTFAFAFIVWPLVTPYLPSDIPDRPFFMLMMIEAAAGLLLGLSIRLLVFALQFAGSVAAQSTSLAQIFGSGITPDPMPAIGNLMMLAGVTLAVALDLHVKVAILLARSYEILPLGLPIPAEDVAIWGTARVASAFALGFSLAAPFVLTAFAYNVSLGAINRAMPTLMVAFIGAPAIVGASMLLLLISMPVILSFWNGQLDQVLANPLALPR